MFRSGPLVRRLVPFAALTFLAAVLGFSPATPASAQTTNGAIAGIVSDAQGGVLPGVTLTLRNTDTGLTRSVVTEADGRYRFGALPPGRYEARAELQAFGTVEVTDITITIGSDVLRNITMQLQGVQESVTVTGEAPIVETTRTDVSGVITQEQMQMLPLASRQPMDLALLMPGTNQDAVRARKANSNIGAGAFTNGSALLVDGVWNKEGNTGEPRQDFPQAAIREFKVFISESPHRNEAGRPAARSALPPRAAQTCLAGGYSGVPSAAVSSIPRRVREAAGDPRRTSAGTSWAVRSAARCSGIASTTSRPPSGRRTI